MNNSFEREMVQCMNRFFTENRKRGFAYRLKQSTFNTQYVDIIVDSKEPGYYLAIECKSLKGKRLSFSSNFHKKAPVSLRFITPLKPLTASPTATTI